MVMKRKWNKNIQTLSILFLALMLNACIEEFGGTGTPFNRSEQIVGSWSVRKVVQHDLTAENPDYATYDVTDLFDFSQYALNINADGSFAVSNTGNAPDFVIKAGAWALDNADRPSAIVLTGQGASSMLDFGSLSALTESSELRVKYIRKVIIPKEEADTDEDVIKATVAYEYTLSKLN